MNMKKHFSCVLAIGLLCSAHAYADRVKAALGKLEKNQPHEARIRLDKALRKNPDNAGAQYVYALYFLQRYASATAPLAASLQADGGAAVGSFAQHRAVSGALAAGKNSIPAKDGAFSFPTAETCLDSAYAHILAAAADYPQSERAALKRWRKWGIDSAAIQSQKVLIDSLAFAEALLKHTVAAYQSFTVRFPTAAQKNPAIENRNALAFSEAARTNTYKSYKHFLETYPDARQAREAEELYELLLFEFMTQDDDLAVYGKFLEIYPQSTYAKEAERRIYELSTVAHSRQAYRNFIDNYPRNPFVSQAWHWIYSLYRQEGNPAENFLEKYPDFFDKNYIRKHIETEPLAYFPVYDQAKNRYGFTDANGTLQVEAIYDSVAANYFCDGVQQNSILVYRQTQLGAIDKAGREITGFGCESIEKLEGDLLLVKKDGKAGVWHTAGFAVLPAQYDSIAVLNESFLLVKQESGYGLANFFGGEVTNAEFQEIKNLEDGLLALRRNNRFALVQSADLLRKQKPALQFLYDSVEWLKKDALQVKIGSYMGIVNPQLQTIVTPSEAQIRALPVGWETQEGGYRKLIDAKGRLLADSLDQVVANNSFYAVRRHDKWAIWKNSISPRLKFDYDTAMLLGQEGFAILKGTIFYAFFAPDVFLKVGNYRKISLLRLDDQPARFWLLVENDSGRQGLLSQRGQLVLPAKYDKITVWTPDLIAVQQNGKTGVVDGNGKTVLPLAYNALDYKQGFINTLKNGKFGLLHLSRAIEIAPQYEKLVRPYAENSLLFVAAKNGRYGLITADNAPASEFVFDEIRYWQFGVALVRQNETWSLYDIASRKAMQPMADVKYIREDDKEIIVRMYANKQYGVLSNTRGVVVEAEYDDLRNVGTVEIPFYLAEKHMADADLYAVFYMDRNGKKVRKQLFDEQRYERVVCE